jgi:hypothetical protein
LNAKCSIQAAPSGQPDDARITNIVVNGQPVGEEFVSWQYGDWPSAKRWIADWVLQNNLKRFEISDGKVILETSGPNKDPFSSESPAEEESPTATLTATVTPTPSDAPR